MCQPEPTISTSTSNMLPVSLAADRASDLAAECEDPVASLKAVLFTLHTVADCDQIEDPAQAALHEMAFRMQDLVREIDEKTSTIWKMLIPFHRAVDPARRSA